MWHPKTDKNVNPSVKVHHLVGKLSKGETLLRCNIKFVMFVMFVIGERLYAPPIYLLNFLRNAAKISGFFLRKISPVS